MTSRSYDVGQTVAQRLEGNTQNSNPVGRPFKSYMEESPKVNSSSNSVLNPAQNILQNLGSPSWDSLMNQVKSSQTLLGDLNNDLNNKNLKFKKSEQNLIKRKLKTASSYLKSADAKLQKEAPSEASLQKPLPLEKLADYIDEGQSNLSSVQKKLMQLMKKGDTLNPADFLLVQLKLAHAQQEIEYTSMMVSKLTDGLRTMMNIQL
ncbi:hypothetical protein [Rhabdochlamydiaceae symbiont of Dictyostelium giganteum]|uniref:hypothetical protein n=1 Tax=Rhabdochlamydiaceae symbiont of Dictyostelium giganteum TaxID=3342349 RepID=UPI003850975E